MFAVTDRSYRVVTSSMELLNGETLVESISPSLAKSVDSYRMRADRSAALRNSDWTQMPDTPMSAQQKQAWAVYRQQLRDLPNVPGFPYIPFPVITLLDDTIASQTGLDGPPLTSTGD